MFQLICDKIPICAVILFRLKTHISQFAKLKIIPNYFRQRFIKKKQMINILILNTYQMLVISKIKMIIKNKTLLSLLIK